MVVCPLIMLQVIVSCSTDWKTWTW